MCYNSVAVCSVTSFSFNVLFRECTGFQSPVKLYQALWPMSQELQPILSADTDQYKHCLRSAVTDFK